MIAAVATAPVLLLLQATTTSVECPFQHQILDGFSSSVHLFFDVYSSFLLPIYKVAPSSVLSLVVIMSLQTKVFWIVSSTVLCWSVLMLEQSFAQRSPNDQAYLFSADAETFLYQPLKTSFSCQGREYGYYADVDNNCQVRFL